MKYTCDTCLNYGRSIGQMEQELDCAMEQFRDGQYTAGLVTMSHFAFHAKSNIYGNLMTKAMEKKTKEITKWAKKYAANTVVASAGSLEKGVRALEEMFDKRATSQGRKRCP